MRVAPRINMGESSTFQLLTHPAQHNNSTSEKTKRAFEGKQTTSKWNPLFPWTINIYEPCHWMLVFPCHVGRSFSKNHGWKGSGLIQVWLVSCSMQPTNQPHSCPIYNKSHLVSLWIATNSALSLSGPLCIHLYLLRYAMYVHVSY